MDLMHRPRVFENELTGKGIHAGEDLKIDIAPKPGQNGTYEDITMVWRAHIVHYTGADIEKHKGEIRMGTGNLGKDGKFKISVNSMMYASKLKRTILPRSPPATDPHCARPPVSS